MSLTKTKKEIVSMQKGGELLSRALQAAIDAVAPGKKLSELNAAAEKVILDGGGKPSFLGYSSKGSPPFPSTVCISLNEEVVHGSGSRERALVDGDLVGLDIGCWYKGLCTDMAATVPVGGFDSLPEKQKKLLRVTREAMMEGIQAAHVGGDIKDISRAVEEYAKPHGFGIVKSLVGHGVGHKVHEDPAVPNYVSDKYPHVEILDGMCLAVEPMFTLGDWQVETADDGWSIITKDRSLGAHFELTIAVTKDGVEILTPPPDVGF